jgi:hypothetical protein
MNTSRNFSRRARTASSVPASVMAMKWDDQALMSACCNPSRKNAASEFGSMVVPDLLARM